MLQNARLYVHLEQDPAGRYPYLSRAEQRRVEQQMETAIKNVVSRDVITDWMKLADQLFVEVDGGQQVELDPADESMSVENLRLFLDQTLAHSTADATQRLATNPETPLELVCKIKVGGQHEDGANCPLLLLAAQQCGDMTTDLPWIVSGTTSTGLTVDAKVAIQLSWTTNSPRSNDVPPPPY